MTTTLIGLLISEQLDTMAGDPDEHLDPRLEQLIDGYRAQLDAGTDLAGLAAELDLPVTAVDVVREIAATAQVHGGTRVIEINAEICRFGFERITVVAYDSGHRGDAHLLSHEAYSEVALDNARATAADFFTVVGRCVCLPGWDPRCNTKGCNGHYVAPVHTPMVLAGTR